MSSRHLAALRPRQAVGKKGVLRRPGHSRRARVADTRGIPHYVFDYETRFRAAVIEAFADSYVAGENADSVRHLQSGDQVRRPVAGCPRSRRRCDGHRSLHCPSRRPSGRELYRAHDSDRDQSYFLFATTRAQLET